MKLVVFGLTISSSWGNGHATIWRSLCRALGQRGHRIVFFEKDVPYYAQNRDKIEIEGLTLNLYSNFDDIRGIAQTELSDADAGIITSYCPDGIAATELLLSVPQPLHIFYDLDTPVTLAAIEQGKELSFLGPRGLCDFDLVLSYTGGKSLELLREKLGAKEIEPLYGCADTEVHKPVEPDAIYSSILSYLGTWAADRQDSLEKFFLRAAGQLKHMRFVIGGSMYPMNFPWLPNIWYFRHVEPQRHPVFYCSSLFTLNITRGAMADCGYCPSGRLFEAAACGVPVISDYWEGLETFFKPGEEIITVETTEQLLDALRMDMHQRQKIASNSRQRLFEEHSAVKRSIQLENILAGHMAIIH